MDFGKAFSYPFQDPDWIKKIGIAALLSLIPIVGWIFVAGWMLETVRRVIQREPQPLAEWNNFGGYLGKGFKVFVVGLVYSIPAIIVSACQQGLIYFGADQGDDTLMTALTVVGICFGCILFVYYLLLALVLPAAYGRMAAEDQMGAAFKFGQVFGLVRAAPMAYVIVLLGGLVTSIVASLGLILCFIGVILTAAYAMAVNAHFYGQAYNVATAAKDVQPATY